MKRILQYIRPFYWYMAVTMLIKFMGTVMELLIPRLLEIMLDVAVPQGKRSTILFIGGAMLLCALVCVAANIIANRMSAKSAGGITQKLRYDLFEKIDRLSARQMDEITAPSAISRLTSDTYNVNQLLARMQRLGVRGPILLLGGIIITLFMDLKLALIMIATLPIIAVVVYFVTKISVPMYTRQQGVLDQAVRVVQENITGIRVVKALCRTDYEKKRFHGVNETLCETERRVGAVTAITNPATSLILNLALTAVIWVGALGVNAGEIQPGVILAFQSYFTMILNAMLGVTRIFTMWTKGEASANRVADVLELKEQLTVEPAEESGNRYSAAILFENVSFSYNGAVENLSDISFSLAPGQTLGVLGPTGSGKSTLVSLLLRFYDADKGSIYLNGEKIQSIPYEQLRKKFGVVFQNDFIMEGSIESNIRYFREITPEQLSAAARDAQADFIAEKENGMAHDVAVRGNNLSGGQKQRLFIARALAAEPEILVLDDASSALDYRTDASLRRAIAQNYRDTTKVIIAQRVSSIMHADLILVLEEGRIIGKGTHEQLMQTCSMYQNIARTQMNGTEGEKNG